MKTCRRCKEEKDVESFSLHKKFKDGRNSTCKECKNRQAAAFYLLKMDDPDWANKRKEAYKRSHRKNDRLKKYGITNEEYMDQYVKQNGECFICGKFDTVLCQDHCHITGVNRKLLCNSCNLGLGHFRDSPDLLDKARIYLINHWEA